MNLVLDYLRPGDIFIDVGANVGVYSLLASITPDVVVHAFEPSSTTSMRTKANVALNGLEFRIKVVQAALGASRGSALLTVGLDAVNRVVREGESTSVEVVPVETLDEYLHDDDRTRVRMMKIDVEGHELEVLHGARNLISDTLPVLIVEANDLAGLKSWLSPFGYQPFTYAPDSRTLSRTAWRTTQTGNIVFLADLDRAAERIVCSQSADK